jgi:hypothetical protein
MLHKPPHGQPCNGCGQCCMAQLCPLAVGVFGEPWDRTCPALEPDGESFACGLVRHPMVYAMGLTLLHGVETMRTAATQLIGSGRGCDAVLEDEEPDQAFRQAMYSQRNSALIDRCLKVWGFVRPTKRRKRK